MRHLFVDEHRNEHSGALEAIRQLRELGATKVRVGDVEVEFGPTPVRAVDLTEFMQPDVQPEPTEESEQARRREWEQLQYFSAGGRR